MEDYKTQILKPAFSKATRNVRRMLLVTSTAGFLLIQGDFMPKKIDPLGIDITNNHEKAFSFLITALLAYYLIKFYIHAQMDITRNYYIAHRHLTDSDPKIVGKILFSKLIGLSFISSIKTYGVYPLILNIGWSLIDYLLPLILGGFMFFVSIRWHISLL